MEKQKNWSKKTVSKSESRPQNKHLKPFKKWQVKQPDPMLKKEWRDRKRQAQKMMDLVLQYQCMNKADLEKLSQQSDITILEALLARYVLQGMKDNKMLVDMLDRHISKAPVEQKIEWDLTVIAKVVSLPPLDEWQNK